jgi:hypothetical protein
MEITTYDTYRKIVPSEGMVLTDWKEGDDILNYSFAMVMYCPLDCIKEHREITEEEHNILLTEQEKIILLNNKN